jgi:hypothetical protein
MSEENVDIVRSALCCSSTTNYIQPTQVGTALHGLACFPRSLRGSSAASARPRVSASATAGTE